MFRYNIVIGHYHEKNGDDDGDGPGLEFEGFCKLLKTVMYPLIVLRKIMSKNGKSMETD